MDSRDATRTAEKLGFECVCTDVYCKLFSLVTVIEWLIYLKYGRIIENDFFKQDWRGRSKSQICQYILMKWTLCFLIGLIVSLVGVANNLAVENIAGMKFVVTSNMMLASM